jgi:hypothetical protein
MPYRDRDAWPVSSGDDAEERARLRPRSGRDAEWEAVHGRASRHRAAPVRPPPIQPTVPGQAYRARWLRWKITASTASDWSVTYRIHAVPGRALVGNPSFDPASLPLSGWWRAPYAASPWMGSPSLAASCARRRGTGRPSGTARRKPSASRSRPGAGSSCRAADPCGPDDAARGLAPVTASRHGIAFERLGATFRIHCAANPSKAVP